MYRLIISFVLLQTFANNIQTVHSLLCYSCVSTQPGCTLEKVDWLMHSAISCPARNDKCVKIIERRGADVKVIRDCLSRITPFRKDIPADHFEGCRSSSEDPKRAVYVDNSLQELELRKNFYNNISYCFCEFDHWCNGTPGLLSKINWLTILSVMSAGFLLLQQQIMGNNLLLR